MVKRMPSLWKTDLARTIGPRAKRSRFWRRVLRELMRSKRSHPRVNIYHVAKNSEAGEVIFVPGKVLGVGDISHPVTVAALGLSREAYSKITRAGGRVLLVDELVQQYPEGRGVKILG